MDQMFWRTTDLTRWGNSTTNADATATEIDINFWILFSAVLALQDHALTSNDQIDFFSVVGNQMYVTMKGGEVFGPFTLPTANWTMTGAWEAHKVYNDFDVFTQGSSLYLVVMPHTSANTFDANATDGLGNVLYALLLTAPNGVPEGGTNGQVLEMVSGVPAWSTLTRNLALFMQSLTTGLANETVLQYTSPEAMTFPAGLTGSEFTAASAPGSSQAFNLFKNGSSIGSITFPASSTTAIITFTGSVSFVAGDVLTIVGPGVPDNALANVSFTLVATLP